MNRPSGDILSRLGSSSDSGSSGAGPYNHPRAPRDLVHDQEGDPDPTRPPPPRPPSNFRVNLSAPDHNGEDEDEEPLVNNRGAERQTSRGRRSPARGRREQSRARSSRSRRSPSRSRSRSAASRSNSRSRSRSPSYAPRRTSVDESAIRFATVLTQALQKGARPIVERDLCPLVAAYDTLIEGASVTSTGRLITPIVSWANKGGRVPAVYSEFKNYGNATDWFTNTTSNAYNELFKVGHRDPSYERRVAECQAFSHLQRHFGFLARTEAETSHSMHVDYSTAVNWTLMRLFEFKQTRLITALSKAPDIMDLSAAQSGLPARPPYQVPIPPALRPPPQSNNKFRSTTSAFQSKTSSTTPAIDARFWCACPNLPPGMVKVGRTPRYCTHSPPGQNLSTLADAQEARRKALAALQTSHVQGKS